MKYLWILFFLLTGCFTGFRAGLEVTMKKENGRSDEVIRLADEIALKHRLHRDETLSEVSKQKRGYFGEPYHYYSLEIVETPNAIIVKYLHEGRLSSRSNQRTEPKDDFLQALKNYYGDKIIEVKSEREDFDKN